MIVLWQTRGCEKHPKRGEGFGAGMRTEKGRGCEKERDRERSGQGAWDTTKLAAVCVSGKKLTRSEKGENPHFHMCANVLSGTPPGALLI